MSMSRHLALAVATTHLEGSSDEAVRIGIAPLRRLLHDALDGAGPKIDAGRHGAFVYSGLF